MVNLAEPAELPKRQDGIEMKLGHVISSGSKSSSQAGVKKVRFFVKGRLERIRVT